jgi:hypothetical protein
MLGRQGTASVTLPIAVRSMAHAGSTIERCPTVAVVLNLLLASIFALVFVFEMFVDSDSAADHDRFLDKTHCS